MKIDVTNFKSDTARRDYLKEQITRICYNALVAELGEEFCRYLTNEIEVMPDDDTSVTIAKNRVVAECADTVDKDGYGVGIIAELNVTIKKWNPTYSKKEGVTHSPVTLDDIDLAIEIAEKKAQEKAEKTRIANEKKEKKIAADKAQREKRSKGK